MALVHNRIAGGFCFVFYIFCIIIFTQNHGSQYRVHVLEDPTIITHVLYPMLHTRTQNSNINNCIRTGLVFFFFWSLCELLLHIQL